jgi:hypothetical protein
VWVCVYGSARSDEGLGGGGAGLEAVGGSGFGLEYIDDWGINSRM